MRIKKQYKKMFTACEHAVPVFAEFLRDAAHVYLCIEDDENCVEQFSPTYAFAAASLQWAYTANGARLTNIINIEDVKPLNNKTVGVLVRQQRKAVDGDTLLTSTKCINGVNFFVLTWCTAADEVTSEYHAMRERCTRASLHNVLYGTNKLPLGRVDKVIWM